ncbi:MAG: AzlD domain-containing protein [Alphaproteobacteria bacterium]|nr:AzlD domain-containing protein [Alphaproteobacteria bacterium]
MGDSAIWIAVLVGGFGTFMWRALGVAVETRVQEDSPLFNWIGCVAYAMVAGLMARVLLMPGGDLSFQPFVWRALAFLIALAIWYRYGKSVPIGLIAGVISYAIILQIKAL